MCCVPCARIEAYGRVKTLHEEVYVKVPDTKRSERPIHEEKLKHALHEEAYIVNLRYACARKRNKRPYCEDEKRTTLHEEK